MKKLKKNKDAYNLTELDVEVKYMIDGCGKKILKPIYIDIKQGDKYIIKDAIANVGALKWLLEWLEQEYKEEK